MGDDILVDLNVIVFLVLLEHQIRANAGRRPMIGILGIAVAVYVGYSIVFTLLHMSQFIQHRLIQAGRFVLDMLLGVILQDVRIPGIFTRFVFDNSH